MLNTITTKSKNIFREDSATYRYGHLNAFTINNYSINNPICSEHFDWCQARVQWDQKLNRSVFHMKSGRHKYGYIYNVLEPVAML